MNSNKRLKLTLEPIKLLNNLLENDNNNNDNNNKLEEEELNLFKSPIKLFDVNLEDSKEIFIR